MSRPRLEIVKRVPRSIDVLLGVARAYTFGAASEEDVARAAREFVARLDAEKEKKP